MSGDEGASARAPAGQMAASSYYSFAGAHTFEMLGTTFTVDRKYQPIRALGKGAYGIVCACKNRET